MFNLKLNIYGFHDGIVLIHQALQVYVCFRAY